MDTDGREQRDTNGTNFHEPASALSDYQPSTLHQSTSPLHCRTARKKSVRFVADKGGKAWNRFDVVTDCHGSHAPGGGISSLTCNPFSHS